MKENMTDIYNVFEKYPDITGVNAEHFRDDLVAIVSESDDDLLIDLNGIDQISSIGIGALFSTYSDLHKIGKEMYIVNACDKNIKLFEMMNMSSMVKKQ